MAGLKGPGAAGGSRAVTHGLPARHSRPCLGHPVPGQPVALPSLALHPPRQSRALCPPCRVLELSRGTPVTAGDVGQQWHCQPGARCGMSQGVHTQQGSVFGVWCL